MSKRDTASASSRPNSAEHEGKRNNRDGRGTADEHGQAESKGGEDSDSDDEDYEDGCEDDADCGYGEEECNSDPKRYDNSLSFDPKPFDGHGKGRYLELGKGLCLFLLKNGNMLYAYESIIYTAEGLREATWIKNLDDFKSRRSLGVITVYMEITDDKDKVGMTFNPLLRHELGYRDAIFVPVVLRSTRIDAESDAEMSKAFDELIDKYSKLGGVTVDIDNANVGVLYELEAEHGVPGMLCLICIIMKSLPVDCEPTMVRKKLLAHFIESGLQAVHAGRLRSGTSPHELITSSNLPNLKPIHEHCVGYHDTLFASPFFRGGHRDYIRKNPIQAKMISSWFTGIKNDDESAHCKEDKFTCFPTFTPLLASIILGLLSTKGYFVNMVDEAPPGSAYNLNGYSNDVLLDGFKVFVSELDGFLTKDGLVECLLVDWFPSLFSKAKNTPQYAEAKRKASPEIRTAAEKFDQENYGVGPGTSSLVKYLHYRGFKPVDGTLMGLNADLVYFVRDDSVVNENGDLISIGKLRIIAVHKSICWPAHSGFDLDKNEPAFRPATRGSMGERAIAMHTMSLVCRTLRTVNAPLEFETDLVGMPLLGNILVQKALHVYALLSCHFDRMTATHLWKLVGVDKDLRLKQLRTYKRGEARTINDQSRTNPDLVKVRQL